MAKSTKILLPVIYPDCPHAILKSFTIELIINHGFDNSWLGVFVFFWLNLFTFKSVKI